jgi:hypothetical protein
VCRRALGIVVGAMCCVLHRPAGNGAHVSPFLFSRACVRHKIPFYATRAHANDGPGEFIKLFCQQQQQLNLYNNTTDAGMGHAKYYCILVPALLV